MSVSTNVETTKYGAKPPWGDILLTAVVAVSWALIGMAGVAALGLHLLGADATASLGPMTAAVVALGAGGSVTPSGDVSAFGLTGAEAATAIEITPLGVSLVGALLLSWFFLRSLRSAGVVIAPAELLARAGAVVVLFVATLGGLAWAGHDVITIDGGALGLDKLPGGGGGGGGLEIPGLGDVGDIGGLLPDQIGDLVDAKAAVGFTVDTVPTLLGGLGWSAGILLIALLASRRTPLPRGLEAVHRVVRPAVSALVTVFLLAVAAGLAAAAYAAIGDDHPKRIAGAALLGTPNGTWLGIPIGLFVPWDGRATGPLTAFLPHPLDDLLSSERDESVSLSRLAELDGRVWLLAVAAAVMMLLAGVLAAVRTPVGVVVKGAGAGSGAFASAGPGASVGAGAGAGASYVRDPGALGFAGRCALRLGLVTALALPLLAWLTEVSVDASLSVLGFDAFGAGIELHGHLGMALLLGALWGAGAGAAGALLARATGAAGQRGPVRVGRGRVRAGVGLMPVRAGSGRAEVGLGRTPVRAGAGRVAVGLGRMPVRAGSGRAKAGLGPTPVRAGSGRAKAGLGPTPVRAGLRLRGRVGLRMRGRVELRLLARAGGRLPGRGRVEARARRGRVEPRAGRGRMEARVRRDPAEARARLGRTCRVCHIGRRILTPIRTCVCRRSCEARRTHGRPTGVVRGWRTPGPAAHGRSTAHRTHLDVHVPGSQEVTPVSRADGAVTPGSLAGGPGTVVSPVVGLMTGARPTTATRPTSRPPPGTTCTARPPWCGRCGRRRGSRRRHPVRGRRRLRLRRPRLLPRPAGPRGGGDSAGPWGGA
ncbi:streptophobe family protein [Streptomyces justiciae]|uniref:streptophobe family protein n=1 Tax=Streptomyces justiciae TaxID=2780140 RepID=UPI002244F333|nr:streptophobe family protein [Streptomyces justiciae]MCW8383998.1 streptophobe family protein [Streptomyces justiciae]